jgi:hypothetical protein
MLLVELLNLTVEHEPEKQTVQFTLTPEQLSFADEAGQWVLEPGVFNLWIGGQQPNLNAEVQPENVIGGAVTITA